MTEIYGLYDPAGELRYIGKARDSKKRLMSHVRDSKRRNTPVYCWIRSLLERGEMPLMRVLRTVEDEAWTSAERELIFFHRAAGTRLLNIADGGDEPKCSREVRADNGRKNARAMHSDPIRKRIWHLKIMLSNSLKNGHCSESVKNKMRYCAMRRPELFGCWANV